MFALYAKDVSNPEELIALFTTLEKAEEYINKSKLADSNKVYPFRRGTLLHDFVEVRTEEFTGKCERTVVDPN